MSHSDDDYEQRRQWEEERRQLDAACYFSSELGRMNLRAKVFSGNASFAEAMILMAQENDVERRKAEEKRRELEAAEFRRRYIDREDDKPAPSYPSATYTAAPFTARAESSNDDTRANRKAFCIVVILVLAVAAVTSFVVSTATYRTASHISGL